MHDGVGTSIVGEKSKKSGEEKGQSYFLVIDI
jgi:hypothetical protein